MIPSRNTSRLARTAVVCMVVAALVASCGDDDDDTSTTAGSVATASGASTVSTPGGSSAAASGDVCADRDALRSSVDALTAVDVGAEGTNGVTAAITDVKDDLAALRESAGAELQPDVQAVQDAVDDLETTVGTATVGSGGVVDAAAAAATLAGAARTLLDSLDAGACGSSTTPTT